MMNLDNSVKDAQVWAKAHKFEFPVVIVKEQDKSKFTLSKYSSRGVPHYVLIDKDGKVITTGVTQCKQKIKDL